MPAAPTIHFTRSTNACDACRHRKVKCSGSKPCVACQRRGVKCQFSYVGRRGYSDAYVKELSEAIRMKDEQLQEYSRRNQEQGHSMSPQPLHSATTPQPPQLEDTPMTNPPRSSSPVAEVASGPAFESRVRSIIRQHAGSQSQLGSPDNATHSHFESTLTASQHQWADAQKLPCSSETLELPSREESLEVFDVFVSRIGANQHFLDSRSFVDSIDMLYQDEATRASHMQTMWFSQYLLVMAIGKLITSGGGGQGHSVAESYSKEALERLPPLHQMGSHGITSVEVLCLASLYFQWCDRKYDAYLYIGSAVRLALALGCALPIKEQQGLTSTRWHRTRVWWTAYIHDRRLSAALGVPMAADERQIRAELPRVAPGFDDPMPLTINIQIARKTGEIMSSFYGNTMVSSNQLVSKIQTTLQDLYDTQKSIPSQFTIDFDKPRLSVTRTSASLHLMLFQAIILCIRPMILQRVKDKVRALRENRPPPPKAPATARLCQACRDAAVKSIRILAALGQDGLYGCFDLDSTFSAAFILVMKGFLEIKDLEKPPEGLPQAADVLRHLSISGSKAAEKRLDELMQFCHHVWTPEKMSYEWGLFKESYTAGGVSTGHYSSTDPGTVGSLGSADIGSSSSSSSNAHATDTPATPAGGIGAAVMNMPWADHWQPQAGSTDCMNLDNFQVDLSLDVGDIYSCYNDPNMPLTGIDELDWAEVGKMFSFNETSS